MFPQVPPFLSSSFGQARRSCVLLTGLALALGAASAQAQTAATVASSRVRMAGSFQPVAPAGESTTAAVTVRDTLSAAEASAPMRIRLMLRMRNADELHRRVAAGEIISREEMGARFLPEARDHQAVADWLATQGLTVTPAGAAHAVVMASGTPVQLEKAFETHFARVQFRGEERTSATVAPSVPAEIRARVSNVNGLQPHLHPHSFVRPSPDVILYGSAPHYVNEIANAYNITPTGLTGAGQTIGIIIDIPPIKSDLRAFYTNNALPQTVDRYSVVDVENVGTFDYAIVDPNDPPALEAALDAEWSSGIATGAKLLVYAASSLENVDDAYSRVLDDLLTNAQPGLHQISMSYGAGEQDIGTVDGVAAEHDMFAAMSAFGVSLFASSGDSGAFGNDEFTGSIQVNYPASDPAITGVGGTSLYLSAAPTVGTQTVQHEYGWSFDTNNGSSGGGYSVFFDLPSYQANVVISSDSQSNGMRQVPDVSFVGDPTTGAYLIFRDKPIAVGGTSWSSPCWAGLCALVNQARADQGRPPLTALNSLLYPLQGTRAFRDILFDAKGGVFDAYVPNFGYDLVTGLGVPNFTTLSQKLIAVQQPSFFTGQVALDNGVYYLQFPNGNYFGYYSYLANSHYIYHFDLGYEFVFNANDGNGGVYLYDFNSGTFFYTSQTFPFPYLYDFGLDTVLYYYPDPSNPGHYNTNGIRYFYRFDNGQIIER